ncbi:hypothetical protein Hanom_Chr12g01162201 [Helianthus anomalus]
MRERAPEIGAAPPLTAAAAVAVEMMRRWGRWYDDDVGESVMAPAAVDESRRRVSTSGSGQQAIRSTARVNDSVRVSCGSGQASGQRVRVSAQDTSDLVRLKTVNDSLTRFRFLGLVDSVKPSQLGQQKSHKDSVKTYDATIYDISITLFITRNRAPEPIK